MDGTHGSEQGHTQANAQSFEQRMYRLKRIAEAQPQRLWVRQDRGLAMSSGLRIFGVCGPSCVSDFEDWGFTREAAAYIAEADPATILDLIDTLTAVIGERDKALAECAQLRVQLEKLSRPLEAAGTT